jgi:hypothetical protein
MKKKILNFFCFFKRLNICVFKKYFYKIEIIFEKNFAD